MVFFHNDTVLWHKVTWEGACAGTQCQDGLRGAGTSLVPGRGQELVACCGLISQTMLHLLQASSWAPVENVLHKAGQNQSQNKAKLLKALQALRMLDHHMAEGTN